MRDPSRSEWDALRSFGVNPHLFFLTQLTLTFSLGCMILSSLSFLSASLGSLVTSLWTNELCDVKLWWGAYAKGLGVSAQQWLPDGTLPMLLKAGMSGLCIALISHGYGARNRTRAQEVMTNLTKSNVWSVLLTLLVFFVVLVWENA
jgi:ABC-type transporter Mla maintaining outer membrane lipid asymmetry permease subunit MlaE